MMGRLFFGPKNTMLGLTDLEILDTYNSQTRGTCNYYSLTSNFANLTYFVYLMKCSCLTLVRKYKTRISAIKKYKSIKFGDPLRNKSRSEKNAYYKIF